VSGATASAVVACHAECQACPWKGDAANAAYLGAAGRHHAATGHAVIVTITRRVEFGDPHAPHPDQLTIEDVTT